VKLSRPLTEDGAVIIPKQARELLDISPDDAIEVEISHEDKTVHELKKVPANGRIYLSEKLRDALNAKEGDIVTLDIKKLIKKRDGREVRAWKVYTSHKNSQ